MYLALRQPWVSAPPVVEPAPAPAVVEPATPSKKPGKRRARAPREGAPDSSSPGDQLDEPAPLVELSAADRRLVWRGEEVALPPTAHDFSREDSGRPLSDEEIAGTVRAQSKAVVTCMVTAAANTDLRATLTLKLLVDGSGRVTRHRMQAPQYLFEHGLSACVSGAVRGWRFPSTGAPTLVTAPFELR